jgi:adenylate cyclase
VVEEGDTILGDGVNIAARVQSLAQAGGICITGTAYDHVKNKLALSYEYVGEQTVKNIKEPVKVYRVLMEPGIKVPETNPSPVPAEKKPERKRLSPAVLVGIALVVIAAAAVLYQFVLRPSASKIEVASKEKMAFPLPDKPSIAVLPFVNLSGDPKQEFFSDGITEDIITALSKVKNLFVIARNSTFTYKGKPVKIKQVSEELGVRYVLEGSVQKSGNRVRITAQLIDALSGFHLWAERYDRDLEDLFALQDEVTLNILMVLQVKLTEGERPTGFDRYFKGEAGLDCYLKVFEAKYYLLMASIEGYNTCRRISEEIVTKWPENPYGYLLLGWTNSFDLYLGPTKSPLEAIKKAMKMVQKVLAIDDSLSDAHRLLSFLYSHRREHDKAITEGKLAVALNPNGALAHMQYANSFFFANRWKEAIPLFQKAIRLNPIGVHFGLINLGLIYAFMGRVEEGVSIFNQALQKSPDNIFAHLYLASAYIRMGQEKEAGLEAAEVLRINPKFTLDNFAKVFPLKDQSIADSFIKDLRRAGLK